MVISGASDITVENNDFDWIGDDPITINASGPTTVVGQGYLKYGGSITIVRNRALGSRGLNVVGVKRALIADNMQTLCKGRAIHVGVTTSLAKGDTTVLDIIVRANQIIDLLDASVDPRG